MTTIPDVAWSRVAGFVRQHTHDLRNELNGLDLEAALLADIVDDPEAKDSVTRIRSEIRKMAANLRSLSSKFAEFRSNPLRLPARELFLIWQDQLTDLPGLEVDWACDLDSEYLNVDPSGLAQALRELLVNAHSFGASGKLRALVHKGDRIFFDLYEPKSEPLDPSSWGQVPLLSSRRGGYGLGLSMLLQIVEANGGTVNWRFDTEKNELVTRMSFASSPEALSLS